MRFVQLEEPSVWDYDDDEPEETVPVWIDADKVVMLRDAELNGCTSVSGFELDATVVGDPEDIAKKLEGTLVGEKL